MTTKPAELPSTVFDLIAQLISRPDVQSVSFPFCNEDVWRILVAEQVNRARRSGLFLQHAFGLSGPDSGLPFDTALWGGYVHIPFEGVCEGDLFVNPAWRGYDLNAAMGTGNLTASMLGKRCHYALLKGERKEVDSATRDVLDGWTLYTSKKPYMPCSPFLSCTYDPTDQLPSPFMDRD